jgi:hypothetical protein
VGKGKELPPDPECFDGTAPARETAERRVLLCVSDDVHLTDEYDLQPRVRHRAFELSEAGIVDQDNCPTSRQRNPGAERSPPVRARRMLHGSFGGGSPVSATIERETVRLCMVPYRR